MADSTSTGVVLNSRFSQPLDIQQEFASFSCFPDLPKELRLLIWGLALPTEGRMVTVLPFESDLPRESKEDEIQRLERAWRSFKAQEKNLAILTVNKEARDEAIRLFPSHLLAFDSKQEIRLCKNDILAIPCMYIENSIFSPDRPNMWRTCFKNVDRGLREVNTLAFVQGNLGSNLSWLFLALITGYGTGAIDKFVDIFPKVRKVLFILNYKDTQDKLVMGKFDHGRYSGMTVRELDVAANGFIQALEAIEDAANFNRANLLAIATMSKAWLDKEFRIYNAKVGTKFAGIETEIWARWPLKKAVADYI